MRRKPSYEEREIPTPQPKHQSARGFVWVLVLTLVAVIVLRPVVLSIADNIQMRTQQRQDKWEMRRESWQKSTTAVSQGVRVMAYVGTFSLSAVALGGAGVLIYRWWKRVYHQPSISTLSRHQPSLIADGEGRYRVVDLYTGTVHNLENDALPSMEHAHGVARVIESRGDSEVARLIRAARREQVVLDAPRDDA